jgi:glycosidase
VVIAAGSVAVLGLAAALVVPGLLDDDPSGTDEPTATSGPAQDADPDDDGPALDSLRGPLTGERFYFVLPDRFANGDPSNDTGGIDGDRTEHGYDPTDTGFYHGGDLAGLTERLDYLDGMGITAIWLTPVMTNQAVQGDPGEESAGYHGYWVTDFTSVDPHLGSQEDLEELVDQAHDREMKVFLDIITNHTADVIGYQGGDTAYVPIGEQPYLDADGTPFDDAQVAGSEDFPEVDVGSFPYTPVLEEGEQQIKSPDWLNDPTMYHNRGDSTFEGESSTYGDFVGLDDLWTERPEVVAGMTDIYTGWVDAGVDGFRIDTVKHVNIEFWQEFGPALTEHAREAGNEDFFMFGEVYDASPIVMSQYSATGRLPATLDFGFQAAATAYLQGESAAGLAGLYAGDDWYTDADSNAYALPTFLGNHDMGRVAQFLGGADLLHDDLAERVELGHTLMFLTRGQPVVYYGDEQGFVGRRGDKDARQDMFATQVEQFAQEDLVTGEPGSRDRYDTDAPLYRHIAELSALREDHPALADGAQIPRYAADGPGVFAVSRILPGDGVEYVVAVNNDVQASAAAVQTYSTELAFEPLWGGAEASLTSGQDGVLDIEVPAMSTVVYRATGPAPGVEQPLEVSLAGGELTGRAEITAETTAEGVDPTRMPFAQVTFAARPAGGEGEWQVLGTDDHPPYRVFVDTETLPEGELELRAVAKPLSGPAGVGTAVATVAPPAEPRPQGQPPPEGGPGSVTAPGTFNVALGCASDWDPACPQAGLGWDEDLGTWRAQWELPAGSYQFKIAIDGAWEENYGEGGRPDGANIALEHGGGSLTLVYDQATHQVTIDP